MTETRWYGWGNSDKSYSLDERPDVWALLRETIDWRDDDSFPARDFDSIRLPAPRLSEAQLAALKEIMPPDELKIDPRTRITHAYGKSCRDLIRLRRGELPNPPDAVVYPATEERVARVIAFCVENNFALVPYGGGTNRVGGIEPREGRVTISLDLSRLNRVVAIDELSQTATIQAGIRHADLERGLNERGFMLGHYDESFEFASLGGSIATRSAGVMATKYGGIDAMTASVRMAAPSGTIETSGVPSQASSPSIVECLIGSEGTLGVITSATMRLRRLPKTKDYRAYLFKSLADGVRAVREIVQAGALPAIAHLCDEEETQWLRALGLGAGASGWQEFLGRLRLGFLNTRGGSIGQGALVILGFEDDPTAAKAGWAICKTCGGLELGRGVAETWLREQSESLYLRDALLDRGVLVDTFECATTWAGLDKLHKTLRESIRAAAAQAGSPAHVTTTVSQCGRDGACLSATVLMRMAPGREIETWETIKHAATECMIANGGAPAGGIGYENAQWLSKRNGELGMNALRMLKAAFDPGNVMNPGKWLDAQQTPAGAAIEYQERFWNQRAER